ncbi:RagB/SusD family nutrient uptake outer membrane protein [Chryseobacterium lathyri]|uniref:Membrane protein n=1 Tax=Chryseobacterium lathyri TaxID=395933 RepID=A0A511YEY0_9FLAO|nr:RagB/SusD family nutrient uptake outer membrane protein [Chryseobacterium lathyri]GEN73752.1 membrane protein [Chryseobacterium lathyri]
MKNYIHYYVLLVLTALSMTASCENFLEVDAPKNQISQTSVFRNKETATAALTDVYTNLRFKGILTGDTSGMNYLLGCYTDELTSVTAQQTDFRTFYELGIQPNNLAVNGFWTNAYQQIYAVNNIIEGVQENSSYLDTATVNQLLGEAFFIRALLHFYLVNLYGQIPYVQSTSYIVNQHISKKTVPEVYSLLIQDLLAAEAKLGNSYPGTGRTRANRSTAQLLLSRAYLYQNNWALAKEYALKVIANPDYAVVQNLDLAFLKDSKSAVLQFMPVETGANTLEGQYFIFQTLPPANAVLSSNFMNSFENGDLRKVKWTKEVSNSQSTFYHPFKYKQNNKTAASVEYTVVFRIEEAYLILAEAENEMGNVAQSKIYLNVIRSKAGLQGDGSSSQTQLRLAILDERRHELFTEFGHRFFDLKRNELLDQKMLPEKPHWKTYFKNLPLPEQEILINQNLKPQNEGY